MSAKTERKSRRVLPMFAFSPRRVGTLAANTFTQLVRMRTFYFLIVFAVLVIMISTLDLLYTPAQHVLTIKRWSFGGMYIFAVIYSIAATALLIPRDLEDRILYTILSKPVPRFEYLLGRLLGVILVIALSMAAMFALMAVLVQLQMGEVKAFYLEQLNLQSRGEAISLADRQRALEQAESLGVSLSLFWGLWAVFLKACVIASVTLLVSTFASSSLFTIIMSAMVVFIGHFHKMALDHWLGQDGIGMLGRVITRVLVVIFPDMAMYDVVDEIITGTELPAMKALEMTGLSVLYLGIYAVVAQIIFVDKEF